MGDRLRFMIDRTTGLPPFLQIVEQVTGALQAGSLAIGDHLPPVSAVVLASAVHANTVLKAYRELSHRGLVEARQGIGTVVIAVPIHDVAEEVRKFRVDMSELLERSHSVGLDWDTLRTAMLTVLQKMIMEERDGVSNRV